MNCCSDCKDHQSKISQLQCKLSQVIEHLSDVLQKVDALETKLSRCDGKDVGTHQQVSQLSEQPVPADGSVAGPLDGQDVAIEVHWVLADACRRKKNIVVSGLPEADTSTEDVSAHDEHLFLGLCE